MGATRDVNWVGLGLSFALVAVAVALSLVRRLGLEASIVWAAARALVQLLLVGVALNLVLDSDRDVAWAVLWVVAMVLPAYTVRRRARDVPNVLPIALAAFGAAAVVTLGILFGFGVFPLEASALIPMAGIMIGNSMSATVLVGNRLHRELRDKRDEVEARLALGLPAADAARPYVRQALRDALTPQIETTKAVGLIFLPGAMTGLILAGVDPFDAVRVQLAVMYLVLASTAIVVTVVGLGVQRRLFSADHRLVLPGR